MAEFESKDRIPVLRNRDFSMKGTFTPKFVEVCSSKYEISVEASSFNKNRIAFQYRGLGDLLLASPKVYVDCILTVSGPGKCMEQMSSLPILRTVSSCAQNAIAEGNVNAPGCTFGNSLALGEMDCLSKACTSAQMTLNSASITSADRHKFWQTLIRAWVPPKTQSRVYSGCGGVCDKFDTVAIGGIARLDQNTSHATFGATMDSGVSRRLKNFMSRSVPLPGTADTFARDLHIRWPVTLGPFHPFCGEPIFSGSPFAKLPLGIVGIQSGSFEFQFRNLYATIVRQLGRLTADAANAHDTNSGLGGVVVAFKAGTKPIMRMTFLRLGAQRKFPEQLSYNIFRTQTVTHTPMKVGDGSAYALMPGLCGTDGLIGLPPIGRDARLVTNAVGTARINAAAVRTPWRVNFDDKFQWELTYNSMQLPSAPEYLLLTCEKNNEMFSLKHATAALAAGSIYPYGDARQNFSVQGWTAGAVGAAVNGQVDIIRGRSKDINTLNNLTIDCLEVEVQNGSGSFKYLDRDLASIRDKDDLYRATLQNVNESYLEDSGQYAHDSRCNFVLLHVSQYLFGITSSAVSYPLTVSCRCQVSNRSKYICGSQFAPNSTWSYPMIHHGPIASEPVCVSIYTNGILTLSEGGNAVVNGWVASAKDLEAAVYSAAAQNPL